MTKYTATNRGRTWALVAILTLVVAPFAAIFTTLAHYTPASRTLLDAANDVVAAANRHDWAAVAAVDPDCRPAPGASWAAVDALMAGSTFVLADSVQDNGVGLVTVDTIGGVRDGSESVTTWRLADGEWSVVADGQC